MKSMLFGSLICSTLIKYTKKAKKVFKLKVCMWKLRDNEVKKAFIERIVENAISQTVEDIWNALKSNLWKLLKTYVE